ncbi:DMT family transporter [Thalassobium sp. R2A62]|jgi:drug/metabolite transporter (DMT)-like permease|uniref:DMT family transporter n=1 Tax=Thalassobium sp. R2A62 TaxID=633131 RepID=UPI0001B1D190|nr:DMT family transporter [Thalassobium sp. R2A62]EET46241.1 transporter, dme family [Thalassobium sp. R2A62]
MQIDKPFIGILLMIGFCVLAPMGDAMAKVLGGTVSLGMLLLVRFGIQVIILVPYIFLTGGSFAMPRRAVRLTIQRTILHIIGIGAMFTGLRYLPLADAVAIAFVMPFIMLLLGKTVLGEEVGPHRLAACAVGFVGTLLVVQPNFVDVGWPALWPLLVAVVFAMFMLVTRQVAKEVDPLVLQANSGLIATAILLPIIVFSTGLEPLEWGIPATSLAWLLLPLGLLGTLAHLLMTWSLRFAPSATLAPVQYLEIPIATVIGLAIFGDLPNGWAAVGIVITICAGLYILMRERAIARAQP